MRILFLLIYVLVVSVSAYTQPYKNLIVASNPEEVGMSSERLQRMDQVLNEYIKMNAIPGAVVMVVRNGKVAHYKAYGYSDVEKKTALKRDDIFRIASQTKAITSLAVMMLWEEGKFMLDEPVSKYIPEFKNPTVLMSFNPKDSSYVAEPAKSEITIRQLLTHSSGIDYAAIGSAEFQSIYAKAGIPSGIGSADTKMILADKMKILGKMPLKHQPGERWTYGLNTDVLGYLVEVWSGMTFDEFLRKRIFEPLGMKDTYFYQPVANHSRLVRLYQGTPEGTIKKVETKAYDNFNVDYPNSKGSYFSGGAGLSSTVEDYAKFLQLFLKKGEYNGVRLLGRKTIELMLTDQQIKGAQVGLGFGLETKENDYQSVMSLGSFQWGGAFNTHYWADPKENLIAILYTNIYQTPHWSIGDKFKTLTYQAIVD